MKLKKLAAVLAAVAVFQLSACSNSNNTESTVGKSIENDINSNIESTAEKKQKQTTVQTSETKKVSAEKSDDPIDELNDIVAKDVEDTLDALYSEYEQLKSEIDTYDKYLSNTDKMEAFYEKICDVHKSLCIRMCEYSIDYVNIIINSDMSYDDMYDELDELYDNIYDDAGDDIYDGVYDGILDDMYDDYYDGILDIDYDDIDNYKEWSNAHSAEYKLWSNTRSDVYGDWSDFRSDVYSFWSDIRSAMWSDDIDRVIKKIEKFQKNIDKLNGVRTTETENVDVTTIAEKKEDSTSTSNGIRPEFKEALDSYEAFFDEYCDIMKKYMENPLDMGILTEYYEYIEKAGEMDEKLDALDDDEWSDEETKYYLEVTTRVTTKMLEIYQ